MAKHGQKTTFRVNFTFFFSNLDLIYSVMVQPATNLYLLVKNIGIVHQSLLCAIMASFVAKICGLMNMVENSLMGQFQIFDPKLFTNSTSCHGFAFVKQKYGCRASHFSDCPLIVALLQ